MISNLLFVVVLVVVLVTEDLDAVTLGDVIGWLIPTVYGIIRRRVLLLILVDADA